jgi:hypothetical protein
LISHGEAQPDAVLRPAGWTPDVPVKRTHAEAVALAQRLSAEARAHPEKFEALAREHSDDAVTRASGGSLGGMRASQLPEVFLDALTGLRPGQVSEVVTTSQGFHILLSRLAPPRETVAGRRIVVRYKGVPALEGAPPARSRDEARALADQLIARAKSGTPFSDLVSEHSEHRDRILHGELGSWSTIAPAYNARELETLGNLDVGAIAEPMDSVFGYQVIQRVEAGPPRQYAMASIRIKHSPALPPEDPRSKPSAEREAQGLARKFRESPSEFTRNPGLHGPVETEVWEFGHGEPELTAALDKLGFNEVAAAPVEIPFYFVVPMRLDPALVPRHEPSIKYELPVRATPDLEGIFRNAQGSGLVPYLAELKRPEVAAQMALAPEAQTEFRSTMEELEKKVAASREAPERVDAYLGAQKRLYRSLPAATYATVMSMVHLWAAKVMLTGR